MGKIMNVSHAIRQRRTVRGFKPDPVPDDILAKVLETARYSASNCNTQPWYLTIVSGDARHRLEEKLIAQVKSGASQTPAFRLGDAGLEGVYKERQYACAASYFGVMGVTREDKDGRKALSLKNWQFFGAPHVAFLSMPLSMGEANALDMGIYLQSLMLLFFEAGIACCAQGALTRYPEPIFEIAGIPESHGILCGLSFGYEDTDAHINTVRTTRASLEDMVRFVS